MDLSLLVLAGSAGVVYALYELVVKPYIPQYGKEPVRSVGPTSFSPRSSWSGCGLTLPVDYPGTENWVGDTHPAYRLGYRIALNCGAGFDHVQRNANGTYTVHFTDGAFREVCLRQ